MWSLKTGFKTSSVASLVWHVAPSCWKQMLPISYSSIFVNKNSFKRRKMAQLCFWTKFRTKQLLVLGASAFQCMCAGFLCPKCDNLACLLTRQDQNEHNLKRWFFFAKVGIFCKSIVGPLSPGLFKRIHNHIRLAEG